MDKLNNIKSEDLIWSADEAKEWKQMPINLPKN
jgi:hypothetical protein